MVTKLALECGSDIPIMSLGLVLHQPTIKEISYIGGEESLYKACNFILTNKNDLDLKMDKKDLEKVRDFDIIMTMMNGNEPAAIELKVLVLQLLSLLFPTQRVKIEEGNIVFIDEEESNKKVLNSNSFLELREVIRQIFRLNPSEEDGYNPSGDLSAKIAQKFEERKKKLRELEGEKGDEGLSIFSTYVSVLQVALNLDLHTLTSYTVYQLFDSFIRYQMKANYDLKIQIQLAGGKLEGEDKDGEWQNWARAIK
jgi:hypothetical protein